MRDFIFRVWIIKNNKKIFDLLKYNQYVKLPVYDYKRIGVKTLSISYQLFELCVKECGTLHAFES